jgi:hypothetical protein
MYGIPIVLVVKKKAYNSKNKKLMMEKFNLLDLKINGD